MTTITLIGSGNVAWHLGKAFVKAGHSIEQVYSRNQGHAAALAELLPNCTVSTTTDFSKSNSTLFIIAVSDNTLEELISKIILPKNAIVVHTSGSMSLEVLNKFEHHGVFYLLQTFTKGKDISLSETPIGVEASDKTTYSALHQLARSLSKNVQPISSAQRKIIHIAAVFACNFTNHLFSISEQLLKKEGLEFSLLEPLVKETIQKAFELNPQQAQTGPAVRGDEKIIEQHLEYLRNEKELQNLYRIFSERIKSKKE